jgi:hypothetical protein
MTGCWLLLLKYGAKTLPLSLFIKSVPYGQKTGLGSLID